MEAYASVENKIKEILEREKMENEQTEAIGNTIDEPTKTAEVTRNDRMLSIPQEEATAKLRSTLAQLS